MSQEEQRVDGVQALVTGVMAGSLAGAEGMDSAEWAAELWRRGCERLATELPEQQINTWIRPLPPPTVVG